jgi:hypothetical protein
MLQQMFVRSISIGISNPNRQTAFCRVHQCNVQHFSYRDNVATWSIDVGGVHRVHQYIMLRSTVGDVSYACMRSGA